MICIVVVAVDYALIDLSIHHRGEKESCRRVVVVTERLNKTDMPKPMNG